MNNYLGVWYGGRVRKEDSTSGYLSWHLQGSVESMCENLDAYTKGEGFYEERIVLVT